jgi:hypothetical protein
MILIWGKFLDGVLNRFSAAFQPAFWTFTKTSASTAFEPGAWPQDLLVTSDFVNTVLQSDNEPLDQYLRPVHWIVSIKYKNTISCVIISPHEANELMPLVRGNRKVTLHIYTPRLSLSNRSLEDLAFCAIPAVSKLWVAPSLAPQINLFAGQLYLRDAWEYFALCRFLGLSYKPPPEGVTVAVDGYVQRFSFLFWDVQRCSRMIFRSIYGHPKTGSCIVLLPLFENPSVFSDNDPFHIWKSSFVLGELPFLYSEI